MRCSSLPLSLSSRLSLFMANLSHLLGLLGTACLRFRGQARQAHARHTLSTHRCRRFDIDLFWTNSRAVYVGHPGELRHQWLRQKSVAAMLVNKSLFELSTKQARCSHMAGSS